MSTPTRNIALTIELEADFVAIGSIAAVPTILDVVCRTTGMGFAPSPV